MKRPSLRVNLIKLLTPPLAAAAVMIAVFSAWSIYHEVDEVYDATLVQFAKTLARSADSPPERDGPHRLAHKYERNISYRIFRKGTLVAQSSDSVMFGDLAPPPGFSDQRAGGEKWRFFTLVDSDGGHTVEVAEKYSIRNELTVQLLSSLVLPILGFIVMAFFIIWWGVTRGLQQVVSLSAEVDRRKAGDLTPIVAPSIPLEIHPLLEALNHLFFRIAESFSREREFTDNAAHELRTPLAAMKTQAQVILKTENLTEEGVKGFDNLLASIDRAVDMTEGLLSFARLQADTSRKENIDLYALARRECTALEKQAASKSISLAVSGTDGAVVAGIPHALSILIRNIVQNAVKFTPDGGRVGVTVHTSPGKTVLSVSDTGPGIPDEYKQKVFDRFFRVNKSAKTGSGLGLAMVKWIADMHGAEIHLENNRPTGLVVRVTFRQQGGVGGE